MSLKTTEISEKYEANDVWIKSEQKPDNLRVFILSSMYFQRVVESESR